MNYIIRDATITDYNAIYTLKSKSIRTYDERIWGWDENYQRNEFDKDFSSISQFSVVEVNGEFAGFIQSFRCSECLNLVEIHLMPEYRGMGIGSNILCDLQKLSANLKIRICIGCFKENYRAKALYQRLGFIQISESETHYMLEYSKNESL